MSDTPSAGPNPSTSSEALHDFQNPSNEEVKRSYLALLPKEQIIEICLTLEAHVPPTITSTIWPKDLNAAIASLRQPVLTPPVAEEPTIPSVKQEESATMKTLKESENPESLAQNVSEPAVSVKEEKKPPDKLAALLPAGLSQAAYPHTPYYTNAGGAWPHGYPAMAYPHTRPGVYPPPPPGYPAYPHFPHPPSSEHAQSVPSMPTSANGIPSYEEMIVEALEETTEPDGLMAPKDLFNWMAARYPLQSNFRPSASQALQRAFKRGRFIKSANGKYKLNSSFDGITVSRKTTRRPQPASGPAPTAQSATSPFTHAPRSHTHASAGQPAISPYTYTYPYNRYPGYTLLPTSQSATTSTPTAKPSATSSLTSTTANGTAAISDPLTTAQQILRTINLNRLLQMPSADDATSRMETDAALKGLIPNGVTHGNALDEKEKAAFQLQLSLLASQLMAIAQEPEHERRDSPKVKIENSTEHDKGVLVSS